MTAFVLAFGRHRPCSRAERVAEPIARRVTWPQRAVRKLLLGVEPRLEAGDTMNAIQVLRSMHADTKVRFKVILASDDAQLANQGWLVLQPMLKLHEELEGEFVYGPLQQEFGPGTPLGDWEIQHAADVNFVEQLIAQSGQLTPGTPEWRMCVATVMDALSKHVMDEEGQIFGRVEQVWDAARLEQAGAHMQTLIEKSGRLKSPTRSKAARRGR